MWAVDMEVVRTCDSGMEGLHVVLLICQPTDTFEWTLLGQGSGTLTWSPYSRGIWMMQNLRAPPTPLVLPSEEWLRVHFPPETNPVPIPFSKYDHVCLVWSYSPPPPIQQISLYLLCPASGPWDCLPCRQINLSLSESRFFKICDDFPLDKRTCLLCI